jgi:acetylornithine deacetylase
VAALRAAAGGELRHPLVLLFTYDEELGCLGAEDLARERPELGPSLPEAAVIGEPTSLSVVRLHKGHLKARAVLHGVSAHSGYPHLGDNAIERAARAVERLRRLRGRMEETRVESSDAFPESPYPALNVGTIRGGRAINIVPDRAQIEIGVRLLPGMDTEPIVESLRQAVREAADPERGDDGWSLEVLSASPPMELAAEHPLHRGLLDLTGQEGSRSVSFATDAGWLQRMGLACAVWGPGAIEVAHKPNEFMPKDEFFAAAATLDRAIDRFCRHGRTEA